MTGQWDYDMLKKMWWYMHVKPFWYNTGEWRTDYRRTDRTAIHTYIHTYIQMLRLKWHCHSTVAGALYKIIVSVHCYVNIDRQHCWRAVIVYSTVCYGWIHHIKNRGYNKNCVLCPRRLTLWKYLCCFLSLYYEPYTFFTFIQFMPK